MELITEEQIQEVREKIAIDEELNNLKELKKPLLEEKEKVDKELESIRDQFKEIDIQKELSNNLTIKGKSYSHEIFVERQNKIRDLQSWFSRARIAKEYKLRETGTLRNQLKQINLEIQTRKNQIREEVLNYS